MIQPNEIEPYLDSRLPDMPHCSHTDKASNHIYETITTLANWMKDRFVSHDIKSVKKIFQVAEYLYIKGDPKVKSSIENVFIYALSSMMPTERTARRSLQAIIPIQIFSVYVQQFLHSNN